jgi:hypothetical protein
MEYRISTDGLLAEMGIWNGFLGRSVRLIACGGTGLTLLVVKDSTKDIDFIVPDVGEHDYLLSILEQFGYKQVTGSGWARGGGFIFYLFRGSRIHTTELLESPLEKGNHFVFKEFSRIYLGILNYYDLIISKLFRGTSVDFDDCIALMVAKHCEIKVDRLCDRYRETAKYDVAEERILKNLDSFLGLIRKKGLYDDKTLAS